MIGLKMQTNKLILGDAYKLIKEMPDKSVDCVYTDIPYLMDSGAAKGSELADRINRIQQTQIKNIRQGIDMSILDEFIRVSKKVNVYIWCSKLQIPGILDYFVNKGYYYEILVWTKSNPTPQVKNTWLPDVEYCLYFREQGVKLNEGYDHKSKWFSSSLNTYDKQQYDHPTIKPLELVKRHLQHTTQPGDLVLDPFSGSGTTCVAAKETDRNYLGFEIDERYYKLATDRINGINQYGQLSIFTNMEEQ
jgi:DNA modification methylase